jgi:hypothetical protein
MLNHISMKIFKNIPETNCPRTNVQVVEPFCVGGFLYMEVWKDIKDYKGHYQVSNLGRVKSIKNNTEKILKIANISNGYLGICLCKDGIQSTKKIHRLVADAFLELDSTLQVNHIDGNKHNNNLSNLEVVNCRANVQKYHLSKSGRNKLMGCFFHKTSGLFQSEIKVNGKRVYLGYFKTEGEAHEAYLSAVSKYDNA